MIAIGESDCGGGVDDLIASGVSGLDSCCCGAGEDDLDLDSANIALILSLKLFIIACRALIVTGVSAVAA